MLKTCLTAMIMTSIFWSAMDANASGPTPMPRPRPPPNSVQERAKIWDEFMRQGMKDIKKCDLHCM